MDTLKQSFENRWLVTSTACLIYVCFAWTLTALGFAMFNDTDALWHIAAGDLIREKGELPQTDPWSYTAGDYRWLNIAWAWDVIFSWLHEKLTWHGPVAVNACLLAAIITLIYTNCALRSGMAYVAFLVTCTAMSMMVLSLRPLQVSHCMTTLWFLMLGQIFRSPSARMRWLMAFPPLMLVWVNMHGGFMMGLVLLSAFFIQAWLTKQRSLAMHTGLATVLCAIAILCTPYGIDIVEATRRPLSTVANEIILEWQPFTWSDTNLALRVFLGLYLLLLPVRGIAMLPCEKALALLWCVLSFTANRYLTLFAILAAPQVASAVATLLRGRIKEADVCAKWHLGQKNFATTCLMLAAWTTVILPTPYGARLFSNQESPLATLNEEIGFIEEHAEGARLLTHFNLGAIIAYETRGRLPIFVDPRTETAFPPQVLADYVAFHQGKQGWEDIFRRYNITAVILPNHQGLDKVNDSIFERMQELSGWKASFTGKTATVFLKQGTE